MIKSQALNVTKSQMLRGKNVPHRSVEQAWEVAKQNKDKDLALIIAQRKNLPEKILKDLTSSKDIDLKAAWLSRADTSNDTIIETLKKDRREKLLIHLAYNRPESVYRILNTRVIKSKVITTTLAKAALHCFEGLSTQALALAIVSGVTYEAGDPLLEDFSNALYKIRYDPESSSLILGSNPTFRSIQILARAAGLNSARRRSILDYVSKIHAERGESVEKWCSETLESLLEAPDLAVTTVERAGEMTHFIVKKPLYKEKLSIKLQNWGYGRREEMELVRKTSSLRKIDEYCINARASSDTALARALLFNNFTPNKNLLTSYAGGWKYSLAAGKLFNDKNLLMEVYINYPDSISNDKLGSIACLEKEFVMKAVNSKISTRKKSRLIQELTKLSLPKDALLELPWKAFALSFEGNYPYASEHNVELFGVLQDVFLKDNKSAWETFYALADEHEGSVKELLQTCLKL